MGIVSPTDISPVSAADAVGSPQLRDWVSTLNVHSDSVIQPGVVQNVPSAAGGSRDDQRR